MDSVTPGAVTPAVTPPVRNPWIGFRNHFVVYVAVCALLAALNYYTGEPYWVQYVIAGWGIGIVGHALGAFLKKKSSKDLLHG